MKEQTIGELLRKTRIAKNLTLEAVEEKTTIPLLHLLALEFEQFKLIPQNQIEPYLQQYGELVGLDTDKLLEEYQEQVELSSNQTQENIMESVNVEEPSQYKAFPTTKTDSDDSFDVGLRSSHYKGKEKTTSYLPVVLLCLVALGILAFVSFVTWKQLQHDSTNTSTSYSVVHSSSSTSSASSSSISESSSSEKDTSLKMSTEGSGDSLTVNLSNVTERLTVKISLSGADSSWVSVSNSESGDSGVLLSANETTSYTATLLIGATTSLITLGVTEGVTVTINDQKIDTSALTSTTLSHITINIQ